MGAEMEDSEQNIDEQILEYQKKLEQEINENISLVGDKEDLEKLKVEYLLDEVYQSKIDSLLKNYSHIRRTRPDGNCFFRAFGYSYFERLLENKQDCDKVLELMELKRNELLALGFNQMTLEDFYDAFVDAVTVVGKPETTEADLQTMFNTQGISDYIVVYLRLLTSSELQHNADFYQNFIEGGRTVPEFCHHEVEPMYKESDHIHIIALSSSLKVGTRVRYMDRGESQEATVHDFPEGNPISVHLLYRPGHYDILYYRGETTGSQSEEDGTEQPIQ